MRARSIGGTGLLAAVAVMSLGCMSSNSTSISVTTPAASQSILATDTAQPSETVQPSEPTRFIDVDLFTGPHTLSGIDLVYTREMERGHSVIFAHFRETGKIVQFTQDKALQPSGDPFVQSGGWSPDGTSFLILTREGKGLTVYQMEVVTGKAKYLFDVLVDDFFLPYAMYTTPGSMIRSPDGDLLAFSAVAKGTQQHFLGVYDISSDSIEHILDGPPGDKTSFNPIGWTATGEDLFYASDINAKPDTESPRRSRVVEIYKVNLATKHITEVYQVEGDLLAAAFSPRAPDMFVMEIADPGSTYPLASNLRLVNLTTGQVDTLFDTAPLYVSFALSPDAKTLAYGSRTNDNRLELCFRDIDSGQTHCVQDDHLASQGYVLSIAWLPDSESVSITYGAPGLGSCEDVLLVNRSAQIQGPLPYVVQPPSPGPDCAVTGMSWNPLDPLQEQGGP